MDNQTIKGKRKARKLALQALYQWLMTKSEPYEIEAQFHAINDMTKVDQDYFHRLLHGVITRQNEIENAFTPYLDRPIQSLNPIELTVLRLSAFELLHCHEIPYRVVLDEAISLTKSFGSQDGYRYVNGVLNNLARQVRAIEIRGIHE
ncbi:transcription antitermination factor NusB [Legionella nagasakiensis]|uniref:transcription antitermination factor NusB n=1 Tax=Legionella nagasakiensis TaxID=535290 RepID=UPI0010561F90|nr:transcription antitermination factor NusB [Legionella nagasakiensis]